MTEQEQREYNEFLEQKKTQRIESGFKIEDADLNPELFPFQRYCVKRALSSGKFALFEDCGLGKTIQQLEWARQVFNHTNQPVLTPFLGIGSEVYEAIKLRRKGIGFELKESYFNEAIRNCRAIEAQVNQKSLFDL